LGRVSERRARLLACACCRAFWRHVTGEPARRAVEVAERFADGQVNPVALEEARRKATAVAAALAALPTGWASAQDTISFVLADQPDVRRAEQAATLEEAVRRAGEEAVRQAGDAARRLGTSAVKAIRKMGERRAREAAGAELGRVLNQDRLALCNALRDILGNPFRPVTLDPAWLSADGGRAGAIARAIYDESRFAELPVLGDAIEEAGCTEALILDHCRAPARHFRGCWLVDLILAKE
jgi:hypothetical protein